MNTALLVILFLAVAGDIGFTVWNYEQSTRSQNPNDEKIKKLEEKVKTLNDDIGSLEGNIKKSENSANLNTAQIRDFQSQIQGFQSQIQGLQQEIKTLPNNGTIEKLQNQIQALPNNSTIQTVPNNEIIESLQIQIQKLQQEQKNLNQSLQENNDYAQQLYTEYTKISNQKPPSIDWNQLSSVIDKRVQQSPDISSIRNRLNQLEAENKGLRAELEALKKPVSSAPSARVTEVMRGRAVQPAPPKPEYFVPPEQDVITPDENYVHFLKENAVMLEGALPDRFYKAFIKDLDEVLDEEDFDDPQEVMVAVHGTIQTNIFESFSRVKPDKKPVLEQFLQTAGYVPLNLKAGDNITTCTRFFQHMFPETSFHPEQEKLIKQIDIQPYRICYDDDGTTEELLLKGDCTYYGRSY